jgi:hypothetical protein
MPLMEMFTHAAKNYFSPILTPNAPIQKTLGRADWLTTMTRCTTNPLGIKGCGEAGAIGSPPAVINAIANALGVERLDMPATPWRVWEALCSRELLTAAE